MFALYIHHPFILNFLFSEIIRRANTGLKIAENFCWGKNTINQRSEDVGLFTLAYQGTSYLNFIRNKTFIDFPSTGKIRMTSRIKNSQKREQARSSHPTQR